MPRQPCKYVYKTGAKKGTECGRTGNADYCFQHANQMRKSGHPSPTVTPTTSTSGDDFIQLTNTPSTPSK